MPFYHAILYILILLHIEYHLIFHVDSSYPVHVDSFYIRHEAIHYGTLIE
jgi:hypothetical protein